MLPLTLPVASGLIGICARAGYLSRRGQMKNPRGHRGHTRLIFQILMSMDTVISLHLFKDRARPLLELQLQARFADLLWSTHAPRNLPQASSFSMLKSK